MWIFLVTILLAYAGMHVYVFRRLRRALPGRTGLHEVLRGVFFIMPVAPFVIRALDLAGLPGPSRVLAWLGYPWIAWIFWAACLLLAIDAWNRLLQAAAGAWPAAARAQLPPRVAIAVTAVAVAVLSIWGLIEAGRIRTREVWIQTEWLPRGSKPIRVVHISDLHLSPERGPTVVRKVAARVRELQPDVLVSTGDLCDGALAGIADLAEPLRAIRPPLGKFAVLGNHEFYARLRNALPFHEAAGFRLLRQESVAVTPALIIGGVDDPAGLHTGQPCFPNEARLVGPRPGGGFTILLKHQPLVSPEALGRFDLQLSGHLHGGQIFPFQLFLKLLYPFGRGAYRLGDRSLLYVSRGAGTWGPPMRLLAPPEVTLFVIEPAR